DKKYTAFCNSLITRKGLSHQVVFKGITTKPAQVLLNASVCAFPSAFEGFGLALTEAMAAGLPVIGFNYCSGVNELIKNGHDGFLVKDVNEFSEKLDLLLNDETLRRILGKQAQEISQTYSMDNIITQWENLIKLVIKE
ncbi:MAG: glycosyltransferase, partial [Alphaproteobacteria bacterium]|nr:glycosyltransferase [Alphaproteobacteria bacterium]